MRFVKSWTDSLHFVCLYKQVMEGSFLELEKNRKMKSMYMITLLRIVGVLLTILPFLACERELDWEVPETDLRLVVDGILVSDTIHQVVRLSRTNEYKSKQLPPGVSKAVVAVFEGQKKYDFIETEEKGLYESTEPFGVIVGRTYKLSVDLAEEIDGNIHYESSSTVNPVIRIDSLNIVEEYEIFGGDTTETYLAIKFSAQEVDRGPVEEAFVFRLYQNDSLLTDSIDNYEYFTDLGVNGHYFPDLTIFGLDDEGEPYAVGDHFTLEVLSATRHYSDFLEGVSNELDGADPIGWSGPPANPIGNISNDALGYFIACEVDRITEVYQGETGF